MYGSLWGKISTEANSNTNAKQDHQALSR